MAEERGAVPARVKGTGGQSDAGILRLHFPEFSQDDEKLEEISWDEFFEEFDRKKLALLVEDRMPDGRRSNFNKIVTRATVENFLDRYGRSGRAQSRRPTNARSRTSSSSPRNRNRKAASARSKKQSASSSRSGSRRRVA